MMERAEVARTARALGWTMNEVRAHSIGDLLAISQVVTDEARAARMRRSARGG